MASIDKGYTIERARSGLGAATALSVGNTGGASHWENRIQFWKEQLAFAKKAGRHDPPEPRQESA
jgi:hypothetical protein